MCSVVAAAGVASLAFTVVGTIAQMGAQAQAARAQQQQAEYQARVAENNRIIAEFNASDVLARGEETVQDLEERQKVALALNRREFADLIGVQRAALAGSGVEVDFGSAEDLVVDTAGVGEFERQTIKAETARRQRLAESAAERAAFDFRTQGNSFQAEADLNRLAATQSKDLLPLQLASTALAGGSQVFNQFTRFKTNKVI